MTHLDPILTLSEDEQKNVHGGTNDTGTGQRVKEGTGVRAVDGGTGAK